MGPGRGYEEGGLVTSRGPVAALHRDGERAGAGLGGYSGWFLSNLC